MAPDPRMMIIEYCFATYEGTHKDGFLSHSSVDSSRSRGFKIDDIDKHFGTTLISLLDSDKYINTDYQANRVDGKILDDGVALSFLVEYSIGETIILGEIKLFPRENKESFSEKQLLKHIISLRDKCVEAAEILAKNSF